jgi:ribosome biogenesis GTPase
LREIETIAFGVDVLVTSSLSEDGYTAVLKYITPGMRELGLESANLAKTFADIDELAEQCKFKDCTHENEPGCMVRKAIEEGALTEERLQSYLKLKKEAKYEGMNSKQIEKEKINTMFSEFGGIKNARKYAKSKNKDK